MISFEDFLKEGQGLLIEKMNLLKERLLEKFGDKIFSDKYDYLITEEDMKTTYDILNEVVFQNQLPKDIPIHVVDFDKNKHYRETWRIGRNYGFLIQRGETKVELFDNPKSIKISITLARSENGNRKDNLSASISMLCHEMIHVLNDVSGPQGKQFEEYLKNGTIPLVDKSKDHIGFFQKYMRKANSFGLDVKPTYTGKDNIMTECEADKNESQFKAKLLENAIIEYCEQQKKLGNEITEEDVKQRLSSFFGTKAQQFCDAMMKIHNEDPFFRAYTLNGKDVVIYQ